MLSIVNKKEISESDELQDANVSNEIDTNSTSEISDDIIKKAYADLITDITKKYWDIISQINSAIATFNIDYNDDSKEQILKILNEVVDDTTVVVGTLYGVTELIDSKQNELIDKGKEKANILIEQ